MRRWLVYGGMLAATGALYAAIRWYGDLHLTAPPPMSGAPLFGAAAAQTHVEILPHVLLALGVVMAVARGLGEVFKRLHQPPVMGEILAGILVGPSLLGRIAPRAQVFLLPGLVAPYLQVLSQVAIILFMFLVGVRLDPAVLRHRGHATMAISHASIIAPFLLGALLSLRLYPLYSSRDVPFIAFSLFMGVAVSVTAFPVMARILTDRGMDLSELGVLALTCASVDDVTAWCLLAFTIGVVQTHGAAGLLTGGLTLGYIAVMYALGRPLMARLARRCEAQGRLVHGVMATVFGALLCSSLVTETIGIHAVFGAFAMGVAIPHDSRLARELISKLEDLTVVLLLPAFFAFTGLRTQIGLVSGAGDWLMCGGIIVAASLGKFGGSAVVARLVGLPWRDAASLGVLMNTRGLMELIVLNIGFELHVISPLLFAMLVVMALVTTFATTPILQWLERRQGARARTPAEAPFSAP